MRTLLLVVVCLGAVAVQVRGGVPASSYRRKITTPSPETTTTMDTTVDTTMAPQDVSTSSTISTPTVLFSNRVRRAVPASSYVRTEEGQKVVIPGLEPETTTAAPIDADIGEVFGQNTPAGENDTLHFPTEGHGSPAASSEAITQKSTTTDEPKTTASSTSSTTSSPSTTPPAPSSSSEKSHQHGGGSFGFNVALPAVPTLPAVDKIKIPNPFGFLSG